MVNFLVTLLMYFDKDIWATKIMTETNTRRSDLKYETEDNFLISGS